MTLFARSEPLALLIIHAHLAISAIVKRGEYEETALGGNSIGKKQTDKELDKESRESHISKFQSRRLRRCVPSLFSVGRSVTGFLGEKFPRDENAFLFASCALRYYANIAFSGRELHATASTFRYSDRQPREWPTISRCTAETWTRVLENAVK